MLNQGSKILLNFCIILIFNNTFAQDSLFCIYKEDVNKYQDSILFHIDNYEIFKDECTTSLIDSITKYFILNKSLNYLAILNAICKKSDGYITEVLWDNIYKLSLSKTLEFILFVYHKDNKEGEHLKKHFERLLASTPPRSEIKKSVTNTLAINKRAIRKNCIKKDINNLNEICNE